MSFAFDSVTEFIVMNGHGKYVWLAWLITLLSMVLLIINSIKQRRTLIKNIKNTHLRHQSKN